MEFLENGAFSTNFMWLYPIARILTDTKIDPKIGKNLGMPQQNWDTLGLGKHREKLGQKQKHTVSNLKL